MAEKKKTVSRGKRRELKKVDRGQVHIQSTFNNTLVTITDMSGNVISWSSAGSLNFKGSRKGTPFAAQMAAETAAKAAKEHGLRYVEVYVRSRCRQRVRDPRARQLRFGSYADFRRFARSSQRVPSAQAQKSIR